MKNLETENKKNKKPSMKLDHINFTVKDVDESIAWYQRLFDLEIVERGFNGRRFAILRSGDSMICMTEYPKRKVLEGSFDQFDFHRINHFSFKIDEVEAWEKSMAENKIQTYYGSPVAYPHSTSWYIIDPNGHEIEVVKWKGDEVRFA